MNKYIGLIASINMKDIIKDIESKEIDINFNKNNFNETEKEIKKLIYYFWHTTYLSSEGNRVSIINDSLLYYNEAFLRHAKVLLELSRNLKFKDETDILSYYLYSLNDAYHNGKKYKENDKNKDYLTLFYSIFERKEFYCNGQNIMTDALEFSKDILTYATEDVDNIHDLHEILINCCQICNTVGYAELQDKINQLICFETHYNHDFIKFDRQIVNNFASYFGFELSRISGGLDKDLTVLKELYKNGLITNDEEAQIITTLKDRFSAINGENNYIIKLAKLESLEKETMSLRNIVYISQSQKDNLKALIHEIQKASRDLIKYQEPELATIRSQTEIPREYIEKTLADYETDIIRTLFRQCMVNFNSYIEDSLKRMVDSISSFATIISIDNRDEGLFTGGDKDVPNSAYNVYYSDRMEGFLKENRAKFLNPHNFYKNNAYRGLLNYAKFIFPIHLSLPVKLLRDKFGDDAEQIIYNNLSRTQDNYVNDYYIILMSMIIQIEDGVTQLYNYIKKDNQTSFAEIYLERLFEYFREHNENANGLMYINFVLYDRNGYSLRDRISHGNFESGFRQLNIFLMITVSLIIISSIFNSTMRAQEETNT